NPCKKVRHLREEPGRTPKLSMEEQLIAACVGELTNWARSSRRRCYTGMRQGEIFRAPIGADRLRSTITLTRTKSGRNRIFPMSDGMRTELLRFDPQPEGCVFPGRHREETLLSFEYPLEACLRPCRAEDFRFHDLRHVAATRLAESHKADAFTIAAILYHTI